MDDTLWTTRDEALRTEFAALAADCESVSLARLAIQVALGEYPELIIERILDKLKTISEAIEATLLPDPSDGDKIAAINQYLFHTIRFRGDSYDYYDPRNSYLNDVLSRRCGLPISLCILYLDIAERLGLRMVGVGLPGHFIVRYVGGSAPREIFVDPFNMGTILSRDDCRQLVRRLTGGRIPWHDDYLLEVDRRHIITRLLNNLKGVYARISDVRRGLRVQNYLLALNPDSPLERRDRGLLLANLQSYRGALADLTLYVASVPNATDLDEINETIAFLRTQVAGLC